MAEYPFTLLTADCGLLIGEIIMSKRNADKMSREVTPPLIFCSNYDVKNRAEKEEEDNEGKG